MAARGDVRLRPARPRPPTSRRTTTATPWPCGSRGRGRAAYRPRGGAWGTPQSLDTGTEIFASRRASPCNRPRATSWLCGWASAARARPIPCAGRGASPAATGARRARSPASAAARASPPSRRAATAACSSCRRTRARRGRTSCRAAAARCGVRMRTCRRAGHAARDGPGRQRGHRLGDDLWRRASDRLHPLRLPPARRPVGRAGRGRPAPHGAPDHRLRDHLRVVALTPSYSLVWGEATNGDVGPEAPGSVGSAERGVGPGGGSGSAADGRRPRGRSRSATSTTASISSRARVVCSSRPGTSPVAGRTGS